MPHYSATPTLTNSQFDLLNLGTTTLELDSATAEVYQLTGGPTRDAQIPVAEASKTLALAFRAPMKDAVLQLLWPVHVPLLDEEARMM